MPRISVAMATYNGADHVAEQLASIARQHRLPDELVVADDMSNDQTVALLRSFSATSPFLVRVLEQPARVGTAANFEAAIRETTGDVVALCDQDDVWLPEKLRSIEEVFLRLPEIAMVFTNASCVTETLDDLGYTTFDAVGFGSAERSAFCGPRGWQFLLGRPSVPGSSLAFRATYKPLLLPLPELVRQPDERTLIHDGWIAVCLVAAGPVAWIDLPMLLYRQHPGQQRGLAPPGPGHPATVMRRRLDARGSLEKRQRLWQARATRLEVVVSRLRARADAYPELHDIAIEGDAELAHLEALSELPASRLRRVWRVLSEWRTGRYKRFSSGVRSALADLVLPAGGPLG
jgi:glycosyltransferase involved in cell wall biosynthesis